MHRRTLIVVFASAIAASACANQPHNNVLIFGTDTKVALDISSSPTAGGAPQITLGYKRSEAVWMPLAVNDHDCTSDSNTCNTKTAKKETTTVNGTTTSEPLRYEGVAQEGANGATSKQTDSYSVFTSFGAKFSSEATGAGASGSGALAQFFATGPAAQLLAKNQSVATALKIENAGVAEGLAKAKEAEAAKAEAELSKAQIEAIQANVNLDSARQSLIAACLKEPAKKTAFKQNIPSGADDGIGSLSTGTIDGLSDEAAVSAWWRRMGDPQRDAAWSSYATSCV